jgi:hypothetical protein
MGITYMKWVFRQDEADSFHVKDLSDCYLGIIKMMDL